MIKSKYDNDTEANRQHEKRVIILPIKYGLLKKKCFVFQNPF